MNVGPDSKRRKVVIPGGSGQVGAILARSFEASGAEVVILSRRPKQEAAWRIVPWDGQILGGWASEIDGSDVVINLAGRSVNCRYSPENRRQILDSRVDSTRIVGEAIARAKSPPRVWLQAATATIYAHRFDAGNDEATGIIGGSEPGAPETWRFSIEVAEAWERTLNQAQTPKTRKVALRSAMTMSPDPGGVFATLLKLVRLGLGGMAGLGKQFVSWIHDVDFVRAIAWIIDHENLEGPINIAAPEPLTNAELMTILRRSAGVRIGLPASGWMLELGARVLGTETELILKSRRVVPTRLLEAGFRFQYSTWSEAAADLCHRWRIR